MSQSAQVESSRMPKMSEVVKGPDVEDPINTYFNRTMAYLFVRSVYKTSITPNQVTLLAVVAGAFCGICWVIGTPTWMLVGGILMWVSAILDGADGILARAKRMHSEFGRALDGNADNLVAVLSLGGGMYHLWHQYHNPIHFVVLAIALLTTQFQVSLYDFYKDAFLRMTRLGPVKSSKSPASGAQAATPILKGGESSDVEGAELKFAQLTKENSSWFVRLSMRNYLDFLRVQRWLVRHTNPLASRTHQFVPTPENAEIYRAHHRIPMQLWIAVSSAPHCYLLAICGMMDRLEWYLWGRLILANLVFVVALVVQRFATERSRRAIHETSLQPA